MVHLTITAEDWPIAGTFTISRGSKTQAQVVTVTLRDGQVEGHGESVPYGRYGESVPQVIAALEDIRPLVERGITRSDITHVLGPRAARNALDCALWDLEAKRRGRPVWQLAGLPAPKPLITAHTIALDEAEMMADAARRSAETRPILKLKLGRAGDQHRLRHIRRAVPKTRLIVDANEGWEERELPELLNLAAELGVEWVEQPLPQGRDDILADIRPPVPICADESAHDADSLMELLGRYAAVNIKLDKTGGLTPAIAMAAEAQKLGFKIMLGCMVGTSLSMAPAMLLGASATIVDLDGPLLLAQDRQPGIIYQGALMEPPSPRLWG